MAKKKYEVLIKIEEYIKVVVEADNEEEAHEAAMEAQANGEGEGEKIHVEVTSLEEVK